MIEFGIHCLGEPPLKTTCGHILEAELGDVSEQVYGRIQLAPFAAIEDAASVTVPSAAGSAGAVRESRPRNDIRPTCPRFCQS